MDFAKIAEAPGEPGIEVHQAVRRVEGKPAPCGAHRESGRDEDCAACAAGERPVALVPELPERISERQVLEALEAFQGRVVHAVSVSLDGGITVRVERRACAGCGRPLEDGYAFCPGCGEEVPR